MSGRACMRSCAIRFVARFPNKYIHKAVYDVMSWMSFVQFTININSASGTVLSRQDCGGPEADPGNTGRELGTQHESDTSPL